MKTVRQEKIGAATLRLVAKGSDYVGLLITGGTVSAQVEGKDAEEVPRHCSGLGRVGLARHC